ncbi:zinc metalloprotease [Mucilaginibacter pedocola]|uniref:Peptidase metallopeptidase domain-containing protein n=1 Tax=Mucilaginibacter pedocola TaxID=1792845 RepID=A0A1S9PGP9_9SPHI|nr:M12 family metallopeptidase [Mucilaginibacter pedocola]OOQ60132.1 hypothetical protein BC343_26800 [Mucilaginibacter pedocola]
MRKTYLTAALIVLIASACNKNQDAGMLAATETATDASTPPSDELDFAADAAIPHVCIDKFAGTEPIIMDKEDGGPQTEAVFLKGTKWENGKTLRVFFMNGSEFLQGKVMKYARAWVDYANIHFLKVDNKAQSDIRVGFKINGDKGSWSYFGTDAEKYRKGLQTMNFGWFNANTEEKEFSRTITHEFGHALGLGHEQLSPVEEINWDKPKVYDYYMGPPNNWTRAQVDANIFDKYKPSEVRNTKFDPLSIMQYPVPAELTTDGKAIGWNYYLSTKDKNFIGAIYTGGGTTVGEPANF